MTRRTRSSCTSIDTPATSTLLRTTICGSRSRPAPYAELARRSSRNGRGSPRRHRSRVRASGPARGARELVAEADTLARALDQPGNVRDRQLSAARRVHGAENRSERRERVVGDLRLRVRDPAEQRRLAGVRQARRALRRPSASSRRSSSSSSPGIPTSANRRSARRRRELPVAAPAGAAARRDHPRRRPEIGDQLAVLGEQLRPHRDPKQDVLAVRPVLVRASAGPACSGAESSASLEVREVAEVLVGLEHDVSPRPSPPSGPPFGTYFSRRKLSAPCPPRPACTRILARSLNTGTLAPWSPR